MSARDVGVCMMLCICVKMHRRLYVCGVKQYVGIEHERHDSVKQMLKGSSCLDLCSVPSFS